jgi:hypothetical protein
MVINEYIIIDVEFDKKYEPDDDKSIYKEDNDNNFFELSFVLEIKLLIDMYNHGKSNRLSD